MRVLLAPAALLVAVTLSCGSDGDITPQETEDPTPAPETAAPTPTPAPATPTPVSVPPLSLADVFPPRDLAPFGLDLSRVRTLVATGDVIPARYTDAMIRSLGDDFLHTVAATKDITSAGDITVINLEAPLTEGCPYHEEGFTFCGRPGFIAALQAAGVDVATLENNHIGNYGTEGIGETIAHLETGGIRWADRDTPAIVDARGLKFGFLAFNGVGGSIDREGMAAQIQALRPQVDVLVVSVHWGAEYVSVPQTAPGVADDDPVEIAHLAIDAGADLIIGNHPHWEIGRASCRERV